MKTTLALILTSCSLWAGSDYITDRSTKHVRTVTVTNFVQVPVICAPLELADVTVTPGHTYRLFVQDGTKPWRNWGIFRPGTNAQARLWFPLASTRPMGWQLVDVTPGFPQVALTKQAPDCTTKPQWIVLGLANIRPAK